MKSNVRRREPRDRRRRGGLAPGCRPHRFDHDVLRRADRDRPQPAKDQTPVAAPEPEADGENLREKRADESYRWASLQREEASRVKDQKSIERVQTEKELREVTLTAANAYRALAREFIRRHLS